MPKRQLSNRLGNTHRRALYAMFALLLVSGLLWLGFHYFAIAKTDFGDTHHPLESWWLKLHGLAAMLALIGFGSLMPGHIRIAWQHRKNRGSGGAMAAVMALLALTGYFLYYVGGEEMRQFTSIAHWAIGLALLPLLILHIVLGRRTRSQSVP